MNRSALLFLTIASGLLPELTPALSAANSSQGFGFTDKVVLAYYYIWFQEDNWLKTAASGGRREGLAGLHPLVGAYNSRDPTIIDKHMSQMNRALIDALAVSWWYDTKTNGPNHTLDLVYEKAVAHNLRITIECEHGRMPLEKVDSDGGAKATVEVDRVRVGRHPAGEERHLRCEASGTSIASASLRLARPRAGGEHPKGEREQTGRRCLPNSSQRRDAQLTCVRVISPDDNTASHTAPGHV